MQYVRVGDLARGEEGQVVLDLSKRMENAFGPPLGYRLFEEQLRQTGPGGPPREIQFKQTVLDSVLSTGGKFSASMRRPGTAALDAEAKGPFVLAWFDEAPPNVLVGGREPAVQTMALLLAPIGYQLGAAETVTLPPGLISGTVVEMPAEGGPCGPLGTTSVYVGRGEAVFEFQVPSELELEPTKLIVEIGSDGGWGGAPDIALYDWQAGAWAGVRDPVLGRNVLGAAGLVSEEGLVRLQLSSTGTRSGCYYVDLGVEGGQ
jgi:hypothetical protein